jgi:hypothetical protein
MSPQAVVQGLQEYEKSKCADQLTGNDSLVESVGVIGIGIVIERKDHQI